MRLLVALLLSFHLSAQAQTATAASAPPATPDPLGFHHQSEIGYIVVGGNAKSESFSGKQTSSYAWETDLLKLSGHYLSAKAQNQTTKQSQGTAENWSAIAREEHVFVKDAFSSYVQAGVTGDRFIGVELGQAYDLGGKYFWISNDTVKFFSEAGYRYLHEDLDRDGLTSVKESHFIRAFSQIDYTHSEFIKVGLWAEYLPDMKVNENYRFNFSPYLTAVLSKTFSLKFGYEGYYRNLPVATPAGTPPAVRFDFRHVTALIANF